MSVALVGCAVAIVVFAAMEPWARFLHGRVWHHALWRVHVSHHAPRRGRFERNDLLSGLHAPIAAALVILGCQLHGLAAAVLLGAGIGMTAFGLAYVLVHDGLVHKRLRVGFLARSSYLRKVRRAHLVHHARGGPPFGLFAGARELERHLRRAPPAPPAGSSASHPRGPDPGARPRTHEDASGPYG